jgi:hypothetical protein
LLELYNNDNTSFIEEKLTVASVLYRALLLTTKSAS